MPENRGAFPVRSLAGIHPGELVEVRLILFDSLRSLCRDLGLTEGTVVECHAEARLHLLLRTEVVPTILLDRDWARFIQVVDVPANSGAAAPLGHRANGRLPSVSRRPWGRAGIDAAHDRKLEGARQRSLNSR